MADFLERVSAEEYVRNLLVDGDEDEDVRLHLSALCGDSQGLLRVLAESESRKWINHRVRPYMSPPLRLAVSGGSCDCIEILTRAGAETDLEDVKGQTPLFVATSGRKLDIMKVLLDRGANPDGSRKNRCSPLLIAVRDGFAHGIKLLLQYGADPEPFDQVLTCAPGWPLHHAVVYAHFTCFLELLRGGALPNLSAVPYSVKESIITRLSIPHAILKYAKEFPEFVRLYHEAGGPLRQVNNTGTSSLDDIMEGSPSRDALLSLSGTPHSLRSLCRIHIRRLLGRRRLDKISDLEVPSSLLPFLNFQEFDVYSVRSKQNTHNKVLERGEE